MRLLSEREGNAWQARLEEYNALHRHLEATIGARAQALREQTHALHAERRALIAEVQRHPKRFRALAPRLRTLKAEIKRLVAERMHLAHSPEARQARARIEELACEAERARLRLIRNAFLVSEGLPQTHARPAAWWFLLLSRQWFEACVEGLTARLESLL
ncbi:MAG: hypothetical protein ACK4UU_08090, partial [Fimbriimonadales bacterium]